MKGKCISITYTVAVSLLEIWKWPLLPKSSNLREALNQKQDKQTKCVLSLSHNTSVYKAAETV